MTKEEVDILLDKVEGAFHVIEEVVDLFDSPTSRECLYALNDLILELEGEGAPFIQVEEGRRIYPWGGSPHSKEEAMPNFEKKGVYSYLLPDGSVVECDCGKGDYCPQYGKETA